MEYLSDHYDAVLPEQGERLLREEAPRQPLRWRSEAPYLAGLLVVLLLAAALRLTGVNWDENQHLHPDERFITMVSNAIDLPGSIGEYFDTRESPLNPYNRGYTSFVYGTLPLFLVRFVAEWTNNNGYDSVTILGRVLSAVADLGVILLVFIIGRSLYDRRVGLIAAFLSAFAVLQIQQSHFYTTDTFINFFTVLAFYMALRAWRSGRTLDYALMGGAFGLALASKINAALFIGVIGLVCLLRWRELAIEETTWRGRLRYLEEPALGLIISLVAAFVVFRICQPYAFVGPGFLDVGLNRQWVQDLATWRLVSNGDADYPPSHQWTNRPNYIFPLQHMVLWGFGLPLGLLVWAGFLFAAWELLFRRERAWPHLLALAWVAVNFWYWGGAFAKTMRYFLPIYPFLLIFGAYLLVSMWDRWGEALRTSSRAPLRRLAGLARPLAAALGGGVALATVLYAIAFVHIYTVPVTRVAATRWIHENLPPGKGANEHWDDPLPLRDVGRDPSPWAGPQLELYAEDEPAKFAKLAQALDESSYIFITSNRLYESIPRLPMRYPGTIRYYEALFSGELGFEKIATFTSYPQIFGFELNDDSAEEAFTVYDHPKVMIFRKTEAYSPQKTREIFNSVDLSKVQKLWPKQVKYNGLQLWPDELAAQRAGGTWSAIFDRDGLTNRYPLLVWYLAAQMLALAALPLTWRVFSRLADRGYGLAKTAGLLSVSWLAWILGSYHLLPFSQTSVLVAIAALAAVSLAVSSGQWRRLARELAERWRVLLATEAVFLAAFLGWVWIRMLNPDLWHANFGGEKPMDFAYLNAIVKSTYFPPYDPWFAGGYIHYYYFGHLMMAVMIRLTAIVPWVSYNLAIPYVAALLAVNCFSVGFNLVGGRAAAGRAFAIATAGGVLAAAYVLLIGNLDGTMQIFEGLGRAGGGDFKSTIPGLAGLVNALIGLRAVWTGQGQMPQFDFWRSTRVIGPEDPGPISEFPYFTFLYGDLHAHMIALPLTALVAGLVLQIARERDHWVAWGASGPLASWRAGLRMLFSPNRLLALVFAGLAVGSLRATNTWDFPTYFLLVVAALGIADLVAAKTVTTRLVWRLVAGAGVVYALAQLFFTPYLARYELFYTGVERVLARTALVQYLTIWGFFLFLAASFVAFELLRSPLFAASLRPLPAPGEAVGSLGGAIGQAGIFWTPLPLAGSAFIAGLVVAALLWLAGYPTPSVVVLVLTGIGTLALAQRQSADRLLLLAWTALAVALTGVVEFITLQGDIGRMNTVFKFYLQAWLLLGIGGAYFTVHLLRRLGRLRLAEGLEQHWPTAFGLLLAACLVYPLAATPVKLSHRFADLPPTLDGMVYMRYARYEDRDRDMKLPSDYEAINWMLDNIQGSPVIVEAVAPLYHWASRVSIYTGLPGVVGWDWHQRQQRGDYAPQVEERVGDVRTLFDTADINEARALLRRYDVSYIYVGAQERAYHSAAGLAKFERMVGQYLEVAYRSPDVTIYRVLPEATA